MGVKSLWELLSPVGRPVMLETMEGKAMAIDSSIWIYQFQATMRDKEGRGLVNAHVLGFLRRISKLMFYGIKPVFVFDGGAPALKRSTLSERKQKKLGAAANHAKVAEKLLAAQLRRRAVDDAQARQRQGEDAAGPAPIDDNTVYLEDLNGSAAQTSPRKPAAPLPTSESPKKNQWHDHDPYRLPEVDLPAVLARAANELDPRFATEEELREAVEALRPEDVDVASEAFRSLPAAVQYEIIGDLRLRSRQTSHARLQAMLAHSRSALDFSQEQIKNLKQRNTLTQQLLTTTDSIGKAHVEIPIRIASERNRQYVLVKNEGAAGGWILGLHSDEGTKAKPIKVDVGSDEEVDEAPVGDDSDADMEEVDIPPVIPADPDLREYQQTMALAGIGKRQLPKNTAALRRNHPVEPKKHRPAPVFVANENDAELGLQQGNTLIDATEDDPELDFAIQESLDDAEAADLLHAIEQSKQEPLHRQNIESMHILPTASTSKGVISSVTSPFPRTAQQREDDDFYASPGRLATALSIAGAIPSPTRRPPPSTSTKPSPPFIRGQRLSFGTASTNAIQGGLATDGPSHSRTVALLPQSPTTFSEITVLPTEPSSDANPVQAPGRSLLDTHSQPLRQEGAAAQHIATSSISAAPLQTQDTPVVDDLSVAEDEFVPTGLLGEPVADDPVDLNTTSDMDGGIGMPVNDEDEEDMEEVISIEPNIIPNLQYDRQISEMVIPPSPPFPSVDIPALMPTSRSVVAATGDDSDASEALSGWSRSPSPTLDDTREGSQPRTQAADVPDWDAAQEMDVQAEEGEFARFAAQVKGRNLDAVRQEIDAEIDVLRQQRAAAARDSEDVSGQMVAQIMTMLRLFGIPYITAPMEAEAQCAALVSLGLVDGVITDDSDVFLFGGLRVFKNMFNQSKTVECFLLSDLERELGLERGTLIRLAYLLGSDYTDGLPGVGPVVAMELLKEFPGDDGLHRFKDWWVKVQMGRDRPEEGQSKFHKRFKKRFKETLFLPDEWPNPAVRDAYYHPTVDESEEPFKWGQPDLDALRDFLRAELGWNQSKVDDLLLPIIQKQGKRTQAAALNKQGNLNDYLDVAGGSGTAAPRKRQAYASKRLQQIVSDFRNQQAQASGSTSENESSGTPEEPHSTPARAKPENNGSESESEYEGGGAVKKRKRATRGKPARRITRMNENEGSGKAASRERQRSKSSVRGGAPGAKVRSTQRKGKGKSTGDSNEDMAEDPALSDGSENPRPAPKPRPQRRLRDN